MRSHIGPEGPSRCKAQSSENCPFEPDGSEETNHFNTIAEAREEYENRLKKAYSEVPTLQAKKQRLNKVEKELREQNAKIAKNLVESRASSLDGITFDDANPERAKRRLNEAIEYAQSRYNEHLVAKLSTAKVLPSGAFKTADGKRVNTDAILEKDQFIKHVDNERTRVLEAATELLQNSTDETADKFSIKTDKGTYTLTVKEGLNEEKFNSLPKKLRDQCMSDKDSLNIDLAREKISPEKFRQITSQTQVLDVIHGKPRDIGKDELKVSTKFDGNTTNEKLESAVKNISEFYDKAISEKGRLKENNTYIKEGKEAIKAVTANSKSNTFIPARSQFNGAVVSGRMNLSATKAKEILTPEEIASITVKTPTVDEAKARSILSEKEFGKIFKSKIATLRVTEAKA